MRPSNDEIAGALRAVGAWSLAYELDEKATSADDEDSAGVNALLALAEDNRGLGRGYAAAALDSKVRTLLSGWVGDDDPDTLAASHALALDLRIGRNYPAARALDEDTLERRRRILGPDHPDTLDTAADLARDLRALEDYAAARALDEDTLERRRRTLGPDRPDTLDESILGDSGPTRPAADAAADPMAHCIDDLVEYLGPHHSGTYRVLNDVAVSLERHGSVGLSERLYRTAMSGYLLLDRKDSPSTLVAMSNLSNQVANQGRYAESLQLRLEVLARREVALGRADEATMEAADAVSNAYRALDPAAAVRFDRRNWAERARLLGEDDRNTLRAAALLVSSLSRQGEHKEALTLCEDTFRRSRQALGEDDADTLFVQERLALARFRSRNRNSARLLEEDILERRRRVQGPDHPDTLWAAEQLAGTYASFSLAVSARDLDADTLDRRRRLLGDQHADTLRSARALARDLRMLGASEEATELDGGDWEFPASQILLVWGSYLVSLLGTVLVTLLSPVPWALPIGLVLWFLSVFGIGLLLLHHGRRWRYNPRWTILTGASVPVAVATVFLGPWVVLGAAVACVCNLLMSRKWIQTLSGANRATGPA